MARKLSMPKGSPTIDMTPMVDLAFLLVTFFMLAAKTRSSEPIEVNYSSSISDEEVPTKTLVMMTIDSGGCVYLNPGPQEIRKEVLLKMAGDYGVQFTEDQVESFTRLTSFGCSFKELPAYLNMSDEDRMHYETKGVPADTLFFPKNELKDWLYYTNKVLKDHGKKLYEDAVLNKKADQPDPLPEDFKPKYVIRADGSAVYVHAKKVVETCRDLKLNNLNFVTRLEMKR